MVKALYHVTTRDKLDSILKHGLIPQIGERSAKLNEDAGVFMFSSVTDMDNALLNWLGEELGDVEDIVSLKVTLPHDFPLEISVEYEQVSRVPIPPNMIQFYRQK